MVGYWVVVVGGRVVDGKNSPLIGLHFWYGETQAPKARLLRISSWVNGDEHDSSVSYISSVIDK